MGTWFYKIFGCAKKFYELYELNEQLEENHKCEHCFKRKPTHNLICRNYDTCEKICKYCAVKYNYK